MTNAEPIRGDEKRTPTILIVTSGQLSRNPRVYKEACALGSAGFEVSVLHVANVAEYEAYDRELLRGAPFQGISLNHLDGGPDRLRALLDRGRTWAARRAARAGVASPAAFGPYASLLRLARQHPADLTIVHTETGFCVGRQLLAEGRRVAADFEDWHSEDLLPAARKGRPIGYLRELERGLFRDACHVTTTSNALALALQTAYGGGAPTVIRNVFPLQPAPAPAPRGLPPSFFWFSQTIGPGRGLEEFVTAWSQMQAGSRLVLLGACSAEYRTALLGRVAATKRSQLEIIPSVAPSRLPAVIAQHDIGLALEQSSPRSRDLTITNKLFQYMNAGLAIVATDTQGQREVLERISSAALILAPGNPSEVARQLDALVSDSSRIARMAETSRRAAEVRYCWEREESALLYCVAKSVDRPLSGQTTR